MQSILPTEPLDPATIPARMEAYIRSFEGEDEEVPFNVCSELFQIGLPVFPALIQALHHDHPTVRKAAARVLGTLGDAAASPALRDALQDRDWQVCWFAAEALGNMGDRDATLI